MMKHRVGHKSNLGRPTAHRLSLLATLACQVLEHGGVTTTRAKARAAAPLVERLVALHLRARAGDAHAGRRLREAVARRPQAPSPSPTQFRFIQVS